MTTISQDCGDFTLIVEFDYTPGSPGTMYAPNGDPGDPPEPEELDITGIWMEVDNDSTDRKEPGTTKIEISDLITHFDLGEKIETMVFDMMPEPEPDYPDEPESRDIDEEAWGRL